MSGDGSQNSAGYSNVIEFQGGLGANKIALGGNKPESSELKVSNYPNPFNPSTEIVFTLPEEEYVRLTIYDLRGREVALLVDAIRSKEVHSVNWNGAGHASGVYFYHLTAGNAVLKGKMLLLK